MGSGPFLLSIEFPVDVRIVAHGNGIIVETPDRDRLGAVANTLEAAGEDAREVYMSCPVAGHRWVQECEPGPPGAYLPDPGVRRMGPLVPILNYEKKPTGRTACARCGEIQPQAEASSEAPSRAVGHTVASSASSCDDSET